MLSASTELAGDWPRAALIPQVAGLRNDGSTPVVLTEVLSVDEVRATIAQL